MLVFDHFVSLGVGAPQSNEENFIFVLRHFTRKTGEGKVEKGSKKIKSFLF